MIINCEPAKPLFSRTSIKDHLLSKEEEIAKEINSIDGEELTSKNLNDWLNYFEFKYSLKAPFLEKAKISQYPPKERRLEKTYIKLLSTLQRGSVEIEEDALKIGTEFKFHIPFEGDRDIFDCYSLIPTTRIHASSFGNKITISYFQDKPDLIEVKTRLEKDLKFIEEELGYLKEDIQIFNDTIQKQVASQIKPRLENLSASHVIAVELNFPLIRREEVVSEYITPPIRRKIASHSKNNNPVVLDDYQYEDILTILQNMVIVMERSPNVFKDMKEEDIRTIFLVLLNSVYEGQATGETFNLNGKTDILIRSGNSNIFIAECKFWKGAKEFSKAIDQLISYKPWRDTKTALLIFNTNKNFSSVLELMPGLVRNHPNFRREIDYKIDTGSRFVMYHPNDTGREFILTVLAFDIPR
jgi:hypothetical protein